VSKFPISPVLWIVYVGIAFVVACVGNWFAVPCLSWSTIQGIFMLILGSPLVIPSLHRWISND
jgi:hypothetical protein